MKKLILLLFPSYLIAQTSIGNINTVNTLPTTCNPTSGDVVQLFSGGNVSTYKCNYFTPPVWVLQSTAAVGSGSGLPANLTATNPASPAILSVGGGQTLATSGAFVATLNFTTATTSTFPAGTHTLAQLDSPSFTGTVGFSTLQGSGSDPSINFPSNPSHVAATGDLWASTTHLYYNNGVSSIDLAAGSSPSALNVLWCPFGTCDFNESTVQVSIPQNSVLYIEILVPYPGIIVKNWTIVTGNSSATSGNLGLGFVDPSGNVLGQCKAAVGSAGSAVNCAFGTPLTMSPGKVYFAVTSDTSGITIFAPGREAGFSADMANQNETSSTYRIFTGSVASSSAVIPTGGITTRTAWGNFTQAIPSVVFH